MVAGDGGARRAFGRPGCLTWRAFAPVFANNPAVLYDLYNEPHDVSWDVWLKGGVVTDKPNGAQANAKLQQTVAEGLDWLRNGQYRKAVDVWQSALRLDPGNEHVKNLIQKARNRQQAEITEALESARGGWEDENWVEAVRAWRQVLKIDPGNAQALQALETNQMKIRLVANDLYMLGVNNYVQNKLSEAIQNLKDLLVLDPENQKAKKHLESVKRKIEEIQTIQ